MFFRFSDSERPLIAGNDSVVKATVGNLASWIRLQFENFKLEFQIFESSVHLSMLGKQGESKERVDEHLAAWHWSCRGEDQGSASRGALKCSGNSTFPSHDVRGSNHQIESLRRICWEALPAIRMIRKGSAWKSWKSKKPFPPASRIEGIAHGFTLKFATLCCFPSFSLWTERATVHCWSLRLMVATDQCDYSLLLMCLRNFKNQS